MDENDEYEEELLMDLGDRLVHRRHLLDRGEARWLELLAEFDHAHLWEADGQPSCVHWLMFRLGLSRGTAFKKVRIAHELTHRPCVAQAFAHAEISYSAVRAITRLDDPDPEVDRALVELAKAGTVKDLEAATRRYQLCLEQERAGTPRAAARRGIRVRRGYDGYSTAEITLEDTELDELLTAIRAATDHAAGPDQSPRGDSDKALNESPREDSPPPDCRRGWQKAADALMDLVRTGLAHFGGGHLAGADRYMVHILHHSDTGQSALADGTPLAAAVAERLACDASTVTHHLGPDDEPLALGRKTRLWNTAQHRAITVRDHCTCRFPGCTNRITDIHHLHHWTKGGLTDVGNGLLLCRYHHTLTHHGYVATGDANRCVTFRRPDGSVLGVSTPCRNGATKGQRRLTPPSTANV